MGTEVRFDWQLAPLGAGNRPVNRTKPDNRGRRTGGYNKAINAELCKCSTGARRMGSFSAVMCTDKEE